MNKETDQTTGEILIIDNSVDNLQVLSQVLNDAAYKIRTAKDGHTALTSVEVAPPDLILLTISMPEMDGIEVCRRLKNEPTTQSIPVIFIDALDEREDKVQAFEVGGVDYITKPFQAAEVLARVKTHLTLHQLQNKLERQVTERTIALENTNTVLREKIAKHEQTEEQNRFQANLLNAVEQAVIVTHLDGEIIYWNPFAEQLYGWSAEEVIGCNIVEITVSQRLQDQAAEIMAQLGVGKSWSGEFLAQHRNGATFPAFVTDTPIVDAQGELVAIIGVSIDITERKQIEKKLNNANARHTAMIENIGDVIGIVDADGMTIYQSPNIEKWFGWKPEEIIGTNGWDKMHPEDIGRIQKEFTKLLEKETASTVEYRFICKDGSYKWIELTAINRINDPLINGVLLNYHDITARKQAEQNLLNSKQKYEAIYNKTPVMLHSIDGHGKIVSASDYWLEIMGYAKEEVIGKESTHFLTEESKKFANEIALPDYFQKGYVKDIPYQFVKKNGEIIDVLLSAISEKDTVGKVVRSLAIMVNVTESKQAEDELIKAKERAEESEKKLSESLVDLELAQTIASIGNWQLDPEIGIPVWSDEIYKIYERDKKLDPPHLDEYKTMYSEEQYYRFINAIGAAISDGVNYDIVLKFISPNNNEKWVRVICQPDLTKKSAKGYFLRGTIQDITEQKQAEEALQESESDLRRAQAIAHLGSYSFDPNTNRIQWSDEMRRLMWCEDLEPSYDLYLSRIHPDDREWINALDLQQLASATLYEEVEYRIVAPDGTVRWMLDRTQRDVDERGQLVRSYGTNQDITERKQAEEKIKKSQEQFELAMKASRDGLFDWNLETNEIYYSPGWKRMLGYENDELHNDFSIWETNTHPEDVKRSWEMQQDLINHKRDRFEMEFQMKHKAGHWVDILSRAEAIFDENGTAVRIVGTHVDISDRKRAERELEESKEKYKTLVETASDAIYLMDDDGIIIDTNQSACDILGRNRDEIVGQRIDSIDPNYPVDAFLAFWKDVALNKQIIFESTHQHKNGSLVPVEMSAKKYKLNDKICFYGIARDITERKEAEAALQKNEEKFKRFFDTNPTATFVWKAIEDDFILTDVNEASLEMTSRNASDFIGLQASVIYNDLPLMMEKLRECYLHKRTIQFEHYYKNRNQGTYDWIAFKLAFSKPDTILLYSDIITEQKQAEFALKESEEKYRLLHENAGLGIGYINPDGIVISFNSIAATYMNGVPDDFAGKSIFDLFPKELADSYFNRIQEAVNSDEIAVFEDFVQLPTQEKWFLSTYTKIVNANNEISGIQIISQDISVLKQSEAALQESEEKFSSAFYDSPIPLMMLDYETGIRFAVNDQFVNVFGYTREELIGNSFLEKTIAVDEVQVQNSIDLIRENSFYRNLPFDMFTKSGEIKQVLVSSARINSERGNLFMNSYLDITERKEELARLHLQDTALNAATNAIAIANLEGHFEWVNPAFSQLTGYTEAEALGKNPSELINSGEHDHVFFRDLWDTILAGKVWQGELINRRKDGEHYVEEQIITPVKNEKGEITHFIALKQDVTSRRAAEEEKDRLLQQIQAQTTYLAQIINAVPEGVVLFDDVGHVLLANPTGERDLAILSQHQPDKPVTHLGERPFANFLYPSQQKGMWHEAQANNRIYEIIARPVETGNEQRWVMVLNDVTQQREYQYYQQSQNQLASVGQLAAGIAHDFNNIMGVISIYAEMLQATPGLPVTAHSKLETIHKQTQHAVALIKQILDFSRRSLLEPLPVDLVIMVKEVVKLLERTLPENILLELAYDQKDYVIFGDPTSLQQLLMNLSVNARDAMPAGGTLTFDLNDLQIEADDDIPVTMMKPGHWLRLTVTDTGEGITTEHQARIFDPFFTTKQPDKGTGLGLAQVYGIVQQHNGEITIDSKLGEGTTFTLYFPLLDKKAMVTSEKPGVENVPAGKEAILLVEDNEAMRLAVAAVLVQLNYDVFTAANGEEALQLLESLEGQAIDMVITDMVMPGMSGQELAETLLQRFDLKILIITGHPLDQYEGFSQNMPTISWMSKPFSQSALATRIRSLFDETG